MTIEAILSHRCELAEGPVWDADQQMIWWVDILRGEIHRYHEATAMHEFFPTGQYVGAIALRRSGGLLAAMANGFHTVDFEDRTITFIADPEAHLPGNRFNDGKCDPAGRFWAGTMSLQEKPGAGALYRLDFCGNVSKQLGAIGCSNGLAWDTDGTTFYYIDTLTRNVKAFDYDPISGNIGNSRTIIPITNKMGYPDGMTIDREGMLWIALWGGWKVIRCDPRRKRIIDQIPLPVERITSCTFGGPNWGDLYITTALTGLSSDQQARQPLAGGVLVIKNCGYFGVEAARCLF